MGPVHDSCCVLVVDDERATRDAVARVLARMFSVRSCADAEEALAIVSGEAIDAVLSDLHMPDRNGLWLLERLRRDHPRVERWLMSASDVFDASPHLASGVVHVYVPKLELAQQPDRVGSLLRARLL